MPDTGNDRLDRWLVRLRAAATCTWRGHKYSALRHWMISASWDGGKLGCHLTTLLFTMDAREARGPMRIQRCPHRLCESIRRPHLDRASDRCNLLHMRFWQQPAGYSL
jgi:hypothetical protein